MLGGAPTWFGSSHEPPPARASEGMCGEWLSTNSGPAPAGRAGKAVDQEVWAVGGQVGGCVPNAYGGKTPCARGSLHPMYLPIHNETKPHSLLGATEPVEAAVFEHPQAFVAVETHSRKPQESEGSTGVSYPKACTCDSRVVPMQMCVCARAHTHARTHARTHVRGSYRWTCPRPSVASRR